MTRSAAVFDLDRTLLRGASGPVITAALRAEGVLPDRSIPGEGLIYRIFDLIGETRPSMMLTRQAARAAAGWSSAAVRQAGERAADLLVGEVPGYARLLVEEHRAAGRPLVLATTTPRDLVEPLAERLGFDAVVATRYLERDGVYQGGIDGEFVWGKGKLRAVAEWAVGADVDLAASWAYSDSFYDLPLLTAVAHPHAVNPDPRLAAVAAARRWPLLWFDAPPGVPKLAGMEPQQMLFPFARPELIPWARFDIDGVERIPAEGAALLVANHRSYLDPLAMGITVARRGRPVRFLGKKEVFDAPLVGPVATAMGGIRVERGSGSDQPLEAATAALRAGDLVAILPQGTIPRGRAFFEPELRGRWGAARLAARADVPVIPLGIWGTERAWPRSSRVPEVWNVVHPPTIRVRVGEPVELGRTDPDADTKAIMAAIVDLLPPEARERREPTADELARTFPAGYDGDPEAEVERRPGTD
ncbi:MAG TPA: HAD-IB family hydrolase [Acidimicrobiales bacterium]|nr:HAD-IB family hydrolase [Acidimicrobiales bacterium]